MAYNGDTKKNEIIYNRKPNHISNRSDDRRTLDWFYLQTGAALWKTRAWARKSAKDGVYQTRSHPRCPYIVTQAETACQILATEPVDQFVQRDAVRKTAKREAEMQHSLTGSIGDRWVDMRRRLKRDVFVKVMPSKPIPIAKRVVKKILTRFRDAASHCGTLDLAHVLMLGFCEWICELVLGKSCPQSIRDRFLQYILYKKDPQRKKERYARTNETGNEPKRQGSLLAEKFVEEVENLHIEPGNDCLVAAMKAAGFTKDEVNANMFSFLRAGFGTTVHITQMTLLLVAHQGSSSRYARAMQKHCAALCQDPAMARKSIADLKAGKKKSVTGASLGASFPPSFSSGPTRLLSRAILETVLKFPPVWNLPRFAKLGAVCPALAKQPDAATLCDKLVKVHIYVACCNNIGPDPVRAWNPAAPLSADQHMCSFGLGARYCPVGSYALGVIHTFLAPILAEFRIGLVKPLKDILGSSYLIPGLKFDTSIEVTVKPI